MNLFFLSLIASVMVFVIVYTLYSMMYRIKSNMGLFLVYFVLIMMVSMFIGALIYLFTPTNISLAEAIIINNGLMLVLFVYLFLNAKKLAKRLDLSPFHSLSVSTLTVVNEILMGATFSLASFGITYFSSLSSSILVTLNSYWFFYPMMAEMLSLYLIDYAKGKVRKELFPVIGITTFPPTLFNFSQWVYSSIVIDLVLSLLGIINSKGVWRYIYLLTAISVISTAVTPIFFDLVVVAVMILFYFYLFNWSKNSQ